MVKNGNSKNNALRMILFRDFFSKDTSFESILGLNVSAINYESIRYLVYQLTGHTLNLAVVSVRPHYQGMPSILQITYELFLDCLRTHYLPQVEHFSY